MDQDQHYLLQHNFTYIVSEHVHCSYFLIHVKFGTSRHTGPPSEPGDLSSGSVSDGVLVFSWSPPWAPDGVQLNYTVTVTNTNTSVVRNYTISNTSITLTRSDVEGDGECDQYLLSVTAVNPAGISGPANYIIAVSFTPGIATIVIFICCSR